MKAALNILLAGLLLIPVTASADELTDPTALLESIGDSITSDLSANIERYRAEPALLDDLVRRELIPALDIEYSARLILGRASRDATPEQIQAFGNAMTNLLISRYARNLLEYRERERIEVLPARGEPNPRMTRVKTRVRMLNGKHIPVDYVCRMTDEGWKVFDVVVEGISYITTYRNQIKPQVADIGIDGVVDRLEAGELQIAN